MQEAVQFSEFLRPVALPSDKEQNFEGTQAIAAGWGNFFLNQIASPNLQKHSIPHLASQHFFFRPNLLQRFRLRLQALVRRSPECHRHRHRLRRQPAQPGLPHRQHAVRRRRWERLMRGRQRG